MNIDLNIPKLNYNFNGTLTLSDVVRYYYKDATDEIINMWVLEAENFAILTFCDHTNMRILVDMIYYVRTSVVNKLKNK